MRYPKDYEWLGSVGVLPRMITEALKEFGTVEIPGKKHNPKIMSWAKETKNTNIYTADEVPWCGLFMDLVAKRAGKGRIKNPLWALNWSNFGTSTGQPNLGDVLVFTRNGGGHVGLYVGEDKEAFHVLGGNQNNAVTISRILKKRLYEARRPKVLWSHAPSARPYFLTADGKPVSDDEQ